MTIFDYNRSFPCPTDREVFGFYNRYRELQTNAINSWKRGAEKGLLAERQYKDLHGSRLEMVETEKGFLPVLSFKPILNDDIRTLLEIHASFLAIYDGHRSAAISLINTIIDMEMEGKDTKTQRRHVIGFINTIKLLIEMMKHNEFTLAHAETFMRRPADTFFFDARKSGRGKIVGPAFMETGSVLNDADSVLVGAFYHHVHCLLGAGELEPVYA